MRQAKANKVLEEIERAAQTRFLPIIGDAKGELLEKAVKKKKPKLALEIGTLVGYSAIRIIRNLPPQGKLATLELNPDTAAVAENNLMEAGMLSRAEIVVGQALKTIPKLKGKFDFIFIDAAKNEYLDYLLLLEKNCLLGRKAVIVADNVKMFKHDVANYLHYVRNSGKYKSAYYDFGGDAVEISERL